MRHSIIIAATFAVIGASNAFAAAPADQDGCNKLAYTLAKAAAAKKPAKDVAQRIDTLIVKLEEECAAGKLAEAGTTANEIEAAIGK